MDLNEIDPEKLLRSEFSIVSHYGPIIGVFVFPTPN